MSEDMTFTRMKDSPKLRVAVMGGGAVGGYLGGLLARAGSSVTLIARGQHLLAIKAKGLQINSRDGNFTVPIEATDQTADVGPVDLVLFTVKTYHNEETIPLLRPLVGDDTTVLTLQNGVDSWEQIQGGLSTGHVLPGAIYIEVTIEEPGIIRQKGNVYRVIIGEANGYVSPRALAIAEMLREAGMPTEVSGDILKVLWSKWLFITTLAGVTAASRARLAELLAIPISRELIIQVMREVETVGRKRGVNLDEDVVDQTLRYMESEAASLKASMYTDLESGRPLELEALNGAVVRLGNQLDIPTPANEVIYKLLNVHALKHRGLPSSK